MPLTYLQMALQAVYHIKSYTKGASRQAIVKFIGLSFDVADVNTVALRMALRKCCDSGMMTRNGSRYFLSQDSRAELKKERLRKKSGTKKTTKKKTTKKTAKKTTSKKSTEKKKSTNKKSTKKKPSKKATATKSASPARDRRPNAGLKRQDTVHFYEGHPETAPTEPELAKSKKKGKSTKKLPVKKGAAKKTSTKKGAAKKGAAKKTTAKKAAPKRKPASEKKTKAPKKSKASTEGEAVAAVAGDDAVTDGSDILEAHLVQIDIAKNIDKFYHVKVKEGSGGYEVHMHWGRTGTAGQTQTLAFESLADARKTFEKKFKEKAGVSFDQRDSYVAASGKYSFKKVNYGRQQETGVTWQYYVNDRVDGKEMGWYDYFEEAGMVVEGVFHEWNANRSWLDVRSVQSGHWSYMVDFNKQTQTNTSTHKTRHIRRAIGGKPVWGGEI